MDTHRRHPNTAGFHVGSSISDLQTADAGNIPFSLVLCTVADSYQALGAEHDKLADIALSEPSLEQLLATDLSIWCSPTAVEEHMQRLQRWLSAPDPSTNYRRALQQRQDGTALWFFESDEFSQWTSTTDSRLWLSGIPGCGKTVLSSAIIEKLEMDSSHTVLYFFFDFSDAEKRSLEGMLRSLINQLY